MKRAVKKLFLLLIIFTSFFIISSLPLNIVHAADSVCDSNAAESVKEAAGCNGSDNLVADIIVNILYIVIFIVGIISAIYIVIGGVKYMSSKGDANATQTAKKTILYSLIGLVITSLAFIIVNFSIGLIYGENSENNGQGSELDDNSEIRKISMIPKKTTTFIGEKENLDAHITPMWLDNEPLTWKSSNPDVVSVNDKGELTYKKEGTAIITATAENGVSTSTTITVNKPIEPESLSVSPSTANVVKGKTFNLKATVLPTNANNKHVDWSSSNTNIATINNRGQITGKKEGTTTITAKTKNGKTATVNVKVTDSEGGTIQVTQSLLNGLKYYYQTNYGGDSVSCRSGYGGVSCGASAYLAAHYVLTKQNVNYHSFAQEICNNGVGIPVDLGAISGRLKSFYEKKYHVRLRHIANSWSASVAELKKGHAIIYLVPPTPSSVERANGGWYFTHNGHYITGISYREQGGGQIYIWNPVPGKGRSIGDCEKGECWYNKTVFERNVTNVNATVWAVEKINS